MRGSIAGHHAHAVTAIGDANRIEGVETIGYPRLEQAPVLLSVAANVHVENKLVAIVVVRGPTYGDGGAIADCG